MNTEVIMNIVMLIVQSIGVGLMALGLTNFIGGLVYFIIKGGVLKQNVTISGWISSVIFAIGYMVYHL